VSSEAPVLLHVEDDDATAYLFHLALHECNVNVDVFRSCDGENAISFLTRQGIFEHAPVPDLVVLDLNLPKKHGHDVLADIRKQSALQNLPVIMLTSSRLAADRERSLSLGANEHLVKPSTVEEFSVVIEQILGYLSQMHV
jgi:two-component system, chemotaxis family, response regulator Rcp1